MKAKILVSGAIILAFAACSPKGGWTPAEMEIISADAPLHVLTIYDREENQVLRTPCKDLTPEEISSEAYKMLAEKMIATVTDPSQDGVGIAAPQIGISRRVIAVMRFDRMGDPFRVYPNARVSKVYGEMEAGPEGCLSIPGLRADVLRYQDIEVSYTSPVTLRDTTEHIMGFTAVIFQHECDHLDGVLYIDKKVPGTMIARE